MGLPGRNQPDIPIPKEDMKPSDSYAISSIMAHIEGWSKTGKYARLPIYGKQRVYQRD